MDRKVSAALVCCVGALTFSLACSGTGQGPASPSATGSSSAPATGPDNSTLKVTAPTPTLPANGANIDTFQPTFTTANSTGVYVGTATLSYRFWFQPEGGAAIEVVVASGQGTTSFKVAEDLAASTKYSWKARAESGTFFGPWSATWTFTTPAPIPPPSPERIRTISMEEAVQILQRIFAENRYNLGSSSTREERNLYLERGVAAIHYGHIRYNPTGRDPLWCIKDAGGGRPQADDVIARCDTRDAWDLIGGIGADGWVWAPHYLGPLAAGQNVYPPRLSVLADLPK